MVIAARHRYRYVRFCTFLVIFLRKQQSAIENNQPTVVIGWQEFAGGDLKGLLPVLDPIDKLRMAAWLANGVADIHAVDSWNATAGYPDDVGARDNAGARAIDSSKGSADADNISDDAGAASENNVGSNGTATPVSLIHNDINMDNILLGYRDGIETPLINDFNIAVFRKRNERTGLPCLFRGRFANPQVRLRDMFHTICMRKERVLFSS